VEETRTSWTGHVILGAQALSTGPDRAVAGGRRQTGPTREKESSGWTPEAALKEGVSRPGRAGAAASRVPALEAGHYERRLLGRSRLLEEWVDVPRVGRSASSSGKSEKIGGCWRSAGSRSRGRVAIESDQPFTVPREVRNGRDDPYRPPDDGGVRRRSDGKAFGRGEAVATAETDVEFWLVRGDHWGSVVRKGTRGPSGARVSFRHAELANQLSRL